MEKPGILGKDLTELKELVSGWGFGSSLALALATHLYRKGTSSFEQMENLPKALRIKLCDTFILGETRERNRQHSADGTVKYLLETTNGNPFEMACIPGPKRNTLCISAQSGCRMGCSFCYTGKLGLLENLSASQMIGQVMHARQHFALNRIVMMGMGEPLDNYPEVLKTLEILNAPWGLAFGASKVTLSTIGIANRLAELTDRGLCNIAVSLHSPFPDERVQMVPAESLYPLCDTIGLFRARRLKRNLRLSFEYVVLPGVNDSPRHAEETARLIKPLSCHVNVIPLNALRSDCENLSAARKFRQTLLKLGVPATLRESRGSDINAACGMMAGKEPAPGT